MGTDIKSSGEVNLGYQVKRELIRRELLRRQFLSNFYQFYQYIWPELENTPFEDRPYLRIAAEQFEALYRGQFSKLMFNVPPQKGKSKLTAAFQAWCFAQNPNYNILAISHTIKLVRTLTRNVKKILHSRRFQTIFPEVKVGESVLGVDNATEFTVGQHGSYYGFSIEGQPHGHGCDLLFADDPLGSLEKCTTEHLEKVVRNYKENFRSRAKPNGLKEILIQTRYHLNDPAGVFQREEVDQWVQLKFPMIATIEENQFEYRQPGEPLIGSIENTLKTQQETTVRTWAALYQQNPIIEGGNLFKKEWLQYYLPHELPDPKECLQFVVCDPSMGKEKGDYCAIGHFFYQKKTKKLYLVNLLHGKWKWPEIIKKLIDYQRNRLVSKIFLETDGHQEGLLDIGKEVGLKCWGVRTHGRKKINRAEEISYFFAHGRLLLPQQHHLTKLTELQILSFPNHQHDDIIDVLVYAIDLIESGQVGWAVKPTAVVQPDPQYDQYSNIYSRLGGYDSQLYGS